MRKLKIDKNNMKQLIANAIETLNTSKTVTISMSSLLKLPDPKPEDMPTVVISELADKKMKALVGCSNKEIAWHGTVRREGIDTYIIEDILVYPQQATGSTVESNDEGYAEWLDLLDDNTFNAIRMQGHSHVNMGVTPSATDDNFYELLTQHIKDFYIFIILNKSGSMWINLYDIESNRLYETADIKIRTEGETFIEWADEQIEEHVDEPIPYGDNKISTIGGYNMSVQDYIKYFGRHRHYKGGGRRL